MLGSFATKAIEAVDRLRDAGKAAGLLRPRLFRPFPVEALRRACAGKKGLAVIDQNLSMGRGGILHTELTSVLYGEPDMPPVAASFIGGLGGRDISLEEMFEIMDVVIQAAEQGRRLEPRLLYTERELRQIKSLQAVARAERHTLGEGK